MNQQAKNNHGGRDRTNQGNGGKQTGKSTMQAITAPYNFVPLAETVVIPDWGHLVSHDIPFRDGLCGSIEFTITAHTPIMIGGKRRKQGESTVVDFFQTPDGAYAIPGSSLKGMIRNVLEIATFSRFRQVDDRRLSVRDLHYAPYRNQMTTTKNGAFLPLAKAGWLSFSDNQWRITPCDFSRIEQDELAKYSNDSWWESVPRTEIDNKTKQHKEHTSKYHRWTKTNNLSLEVNFDAEPLKIHKHSDNKYLIYSRAYNLGEGSLRGTLVFTGQPSKRIRNKKGCKHMEFIFHNEQSEPIPVNHETWHDFIEIHKDSAEWNYWHKQKRIPVFYKSEDNKKIDAIGMTMMFRLPYTYSIHDMIGHTDPAHNSGDTHDFVDLLFGRIDEKRGKTSLKGRVQFELAKAFDGARPDDNAVKIVLAEPKPSYYPNYICQETTPDGTRLKGSTYASYFDGDALLRGWKRYPTRPNTAVDNSNSTDKVSTTIRPLPASSRFKGRVVFHNLKPQELGALLWCMTWGGASHLRHSLGMGKPYGYGQVSFELGQVDLQPNDPATTKPDHSTLLQIFTDWMSNKLNTSWENTPQVVSLLAMADPSNAGQVKGGLRYMQLSATQRINEFADAKDKDNLLVLANYPGTPKTSCTKRQKTTTPAAAHTKTLSTSQETWTNITVTWNPGCRQLSASKGGVTAIAKNSQELLATLPDAAQKRLTNNKRLKMDVIVTRTGNAATIDALNPVTEQN
ncbi:MAG: hypothetical protein Kow0096_25350 [Thiohalomonadaceae bacterium]